MDNKVCRQAKFLKYFPNVALNQLGIIDIAPCYIDETMHRGSNCAEAHGVSGCSECRLKYWLGDAQDDFLELHAE